MDPSWILVVDDDRSNCDMLKDALGRAGFQTDIAIGGEDALRKGESRTYDAVVSDIKMAPISGMDLLASMRTTSPETPVILLTAFGSVETAIEAMKAGAFDYIAKPINLEELALVVTRATEHCRLVRENRHLQHALIERARAATMIGESREMVEVFKLVGKVAPSRTAVLIQGESGTGKELIARAIHDNSPRAMRAFVAVNCSAIPDSLLESELFGHVKGAFTGAQMLRRGLLEESSAGTLFLDEIGDLSIAGQAKLLRALQAGDIRRVGSNESIPVDLRVLSASRQNLSDLVRKGTFREDLLYRINTVTLTVPALRDRPEDIALLAEFFLARYGTEKNITAMAPRAMQTLMHYAWPGNVRELEHVIERAVALANHGLLTDDNLPAAIRTPHTSGNLAGSSRSGTLSILQREHVLAVYQSTKGKTAEAARILGISKRTMYRLIHRYGLERVEL